MTTERSGAAAPGSAGRAVSILRRCTIDAQSREQVGGPFPLDGDTMVADSADSAAAPKDQSPLKYRWRDVATKLSTSASDQVAAP